jgi:hypothetical protein
MATSKKLFKSLRFARYDNAKDTDKYTFITLLVVLIEKGAKNAGYIKYLSEY